MNPRVIGNEKWSMYLIKQDKRGNFEFLFNLGKMVPRRNQVSNEMRALIIKFVADFKLQREGAKIVMIPLTATANIIKYEATGQVNSSTGGGPRRTILKEQINDRIRELMNDDLTTTLDESKKKWYSIS
ncbi:hypothetical protein RF11_12593 [Thelohanellus kitauei]|uniref:Uncharacterized protein n=1 Tax=Thelohanellus kitauei TaxID=669202 RepID=A0A0C2MJJ0_THEKT|nr:hypothetical protein RF11_12593 [Thelohanellus kitauei]